MRLSKLLAITLSSMVAFSSISYAKKPDYEDKYEKYEKNEKEKKQKHMPYGLQKKVERGGELPPGWKNKLEKGEVVDQDILRSGRVIYRDEYPYIKGTKIYEIENKIIRISNATREILDVLK